MYREVRKRILAIVLAFCMVGSMPDYALFAAEPEAADDARVGTKTFQNVKADGDDAVAVNAGGGEWTLTLKNPVPWSSGGTATKFGKALYDGGAKLEEGLHYTVEYKDNENPTKDKDCLAKAIIKGMNEYDGQTLTVQYEIKIRIHPNWINMPSSDDLGKQSKESLENNQVSRLVLKSLNGDRLRQVDADSEEDGYSISVAFKEGSLADITVTGHGIYMDSYTYKNIPVVEEGFEGNVSLSYDGKDVFEIPPVYTGKAIEPDVKVTDLDGNLLKEDVDYIVSYEDNVNVPAEGSSTQPVVIIEGVSNEHVGIKDVPFPIAPAVITDIFDVSLPQKSVIYNKKKAQESTLGAQALKPEVKNKKNGNQSAPEGDYEVTYNVAQSADSTGKRRVEVEISPKGSNVIAGKEKLTANYVIEPASFVKGAYSSDDENYIEINWVDDTPPQLSYGESLGEEAELYVEVKQNGVALTKGEDYEVIYSAGSGAEDGGTVTIVPGSNGNYTGERELTFNIKALDLRDLDFADLTDLGEWEYQGGAEIKPTLPSPWIDAAIGDKSVILKEGKDYKLEYQDNTNVGMGQVIVTAIGGNCIGSKAIPFVIYQSVSLSDTVLEIKVPDQQYTGGQISPEPEVKHNGVEVKNTDNYNYYKFAYNESDREKPGSYKMTVRGDNKYYKGTREITYEIVPRQMNTLKAEYADPSLKSGVYTGAKHALPDPRDIKIFAKDSDDNDIVFPYDDFNYAWVSEPVNAGTYTLRITPKQDKASLYIGNALTLQYAVLKKELNQADFVIKVDGRESLWAEYTGSPQKPSVSMEYKGTAGNVPMKTGTDFTVKYDSDPATNTNVGMSYVEITATGSSNYQGKLKVDFEIRPIQIKPENASSLVKLTLKNNYDYTYTGSEIGPAISSLTVNGRSLEKEKDYEIVLGVEGKDGENIDQGTYTFVIKFKGNYSSQYRNALDQEKDGINAKEVLNTTYSITPKNINDSDVSIAPILNQAYDNDNDVTPEVVITYNGQQLAVNTDYTLNYDNNQVIDGKDTPAENLPKVTIDADGNYTGTRDMTFHIRKDISEAAVNWNELSEDEMVYSGQPIIVRPKGKNTEDASEDGVRLGGISLQEASWDAANKVYFTNKDGSYSENADYIVEWKDNVNEGTMWARVVGVNEYGGATPWNDFTIAKATIDRGNPDFKIRQLDTNMIYNGSSRIPRFTITYKGKTLEQGKDYDVTAANDTDAGTDIALAIAGKGNFDGGIAEAGTYSITPKSISELNGIEIECLTTLSDLDWAADNFADYLAANLQFKLKDTRRKSDDGSALDSAVAGEGRELTKDTDYTVEFSNYAYDGRVRVTFRGKGNYASTSTRTWEGMIPVDAENVDVRVTFSDANGIEGGKPSYIYKGNAFAPTFAVAITSNGKDYGRASDYDYEIRDSEGNVYPRVSNCGTYTLVLKGKDGTPLEGFVQEEQFAITERPLTNADVISLTMSSTPLTLKYTGNNRWPNSDTNKSEIELWMKPESGSRFRLKEGEDFVIEPQPECWEINQDSDSDPYSVTIRGKGNFSGTLTQSYRVVDNFNKDITVRFLDNDTTTSGIPTYYYTGRRIDPELEVKDGEKKLRKNIDYYIDYGTEDCKNASDTPVTVTLVGLGGKQDSLSHYCGSKEITFRVQGRSLSQSSMSGKLDVAKKLGSYTYDYGNEIRPRPEIIWKRGSDKSDNLKLAGSDIEYVYDSNTSAGTGRLTVKGTGRNFVNQYGSWFEFDIQPKKLTDEDVNAACANPKKLSAKGVAQYLYTGRPIEPEFDITWGAGSNRKLNTTDYTVTYTQDGIEGKHTDIGTVTATITGKGNYAETIQCEFEIVKINLSDIQIALKGQNADGKFLYTGKGIEPGAELSYTGADGQKVVMDQKTWGLKVAYENNVSVGNKAKVIVTAEEGNLYIDCDPNQKKEQAFTIDPRPIDDASAIKVTPDSIGVQAYDPEEDKDGVKPEIALKNILADLDLEEAFEQGAEGDYYITCINNKDYTEEGQKASLTIHGQGNYEGSRTLEFEIVRDVSSYLRVSLASSAELVYNGTEQKPELLIESVKDGEELDEGDYKIAYDKDCMNAGTHKVTVTGQGHYGGVIEVEFEILPLDITGNASIVFTAEGEYIYTGSDITPIVTGVNGGAALDMENFEVSAANTREPGAVTATVTAKEDSNYAGSQSVPFEILKADISEKPAGVKDYILVTMDRDQEYTGAQIVPEIVLKDTRRNVQGHAITEDDLNNYYVLQEEIDYTVKAFESDTENLTPGPASVTVEGRGHYEGFRTLDFEIKVQLQDADIEPIAPQEYNGTKLTPALTVTLDGAPLKEGTDYTVDYGEGRMDAGTYIITIEGNGGYMGGATTEFTILPRDMDNASFAVEGEYVFTGSAITPKVIGMDEGLNMPLREEDFVISDIESNVNPGTATVTVAPAENANYAGNSQQITFEILGADIASDYIVATVDGPQDYTGGQIVPEITLKDKRRNADGHAITKEDGDNYYVLEKDIDYVVENPANGTDNINPGAASVMVAGIGNYRNKRAVEFMIQSDLEKAVIEIAPQEYNGTKLMPAPKVTIGGTTLEQGKDYTISCDGDCVNAGTYTVTVTGDGNYCSGTRTAEFVILPRDILNISFMARGEYVYNGSAQAPVIYGLDEELSSEPFAIGDKFTVSASNLVNAGTATLAITAVGNSNYTGTQEVLFEIGRADISAGYIQASIEKTVKYTGEPVKPEIVLVDTRRDKAGAAVTTKDYDGEYYRLREDVDYKVAVANNTYPGTASMAISGINNYKGLLDDTEYSIIADLSQADIAKIRSQAYTENEIKPELTVTIGNKLEALVKGRDYTVEYFNNKDRGTATVTIHAVPGSFYTGEKSASFTIGRSISEADIRMIASNFAYTGNVVTPAAAVSLNGIALRAGEDYEVSYENNVNVGTAVMTIEGIDGYGGEARVTFDITPRSVIQCSFSSPVDRVYNGMPITQDIVVTDDGVGRTLTLGSDYTLEYYNNINPGVATVRVSGIGNYGGIKTILYVVNVQPMQDVRAVGSADSVTVSWTPVFGAEGYAVYDSNNYLITRTTGTSYRHTNLNALTTYGYRVVPYMMSDGATYYGEPSSMVQAKTSMKKPAVTLKAGKKKIAVSWKKIKGVSGYEIYRSAKKTKGYKKIKTATKDSVVKYTNKKLTSKKRYYYKIRAYKKVNGTKVYSKYSSPKSVKAK